MQYCAGNCNKKNLKNATKGEGGVQQMARLGHVFTSARLGVQKRTETENLLSYQAGEEEMERLLAGKVLRRIGIALESFQDVNVPSFNNWCRNLILTKNNGVSSFDNNSGFS
jgi:hypothetical protein